MFRMGHAREYIYICILYTIQNIMFKMNASGVRLKYVELGVNCTEIVSNGIQLILNLDNPWHDVKLFFIKQNPLN